MENVVDVAHYNEVENFTDKEHVHGMEHLEVLFKEENVHIKKENKNGKIVVCNKKVVVVVYFDVQENSYFNEENS